jgi:hypothetical protein
MIDNNYCIFYIHIQREVALSNLKSEEYKNSVFFINVNLNDGLYHCKTHAENLGIVKLPRICRNLKSS